MPQDRQKPQAEIKHPPDVREDLNPQHMEGQNIGRPSTEHELDNAANLRQTLRTLEGFDADELRRIPVLRPGTRLQQGATYVNLAEDRAEEFTATAEMQAEPGSAYVPKSEVPYPVWNRLTGRDEARQTREQEKPR